MLLRTRYYVGGQLEPGQPYYNCSAQCGKMPGCGFPNAEYATQQDCEKYPPPLPKPLMGSIHPRNKRRLGGRLARAALAVVHADEHVAYTGPVLAGCAVKGRTLTLTFDGSLLRGETLHFKGNNLGNLTSNLEVEVAPDDWRQVDITHVAGVTVSAELDGAAAAPTGVRYAYYDNPACPTAYDHFHLAGNLPCELAPQPCARSSASPSNADGLGCGR